MEEPRKYLLDKFAEHLSENFQSFCERHGLEKTNHQFITYLIDNKLISSPSLCRYAVQKEFEKLSVEKKDYPKSFIVDTLANKFSISERSVWTILKNTRNR